MRIEASPLRQRVELGLARKAAGRLLGKLEHAVDRDLEHAAVAFHQLDLRAGGLRAWALAARLRVL